MSLKILVTGANGQLGADCIKVLYEHHLTSSFSHETLDITDPENVRMVLDAVKPDVIINCAAYTRVDDCETNIELAYKINSKGPANLARNAHQLGAKLIHISTDYVFDGTLEVPKGYVETDHTHPISIYGKSKYEGEQAVMTETDRFIIIRTAWLFGIGGHNFLKTIYRLAVSPDNKSPLKVIHTQYGSFTHTLHLAKQIKQMIELDVQGIYHATGEGYCTWYDGASYFLKAMGIQKEIMSCTEKEFPTQAVRPRNSILDNYRLKADQINMMPHWQESIDSFVTLFKEECLKNGQH